jgi:hypothetical protein
MRQVAERADDDDDGPPDLVRGSRWFPKILCRGFVDNAVGPPAIHPNVLSRPIPITTIENRNHRTTLNVDKSKRGFVSSRLFIVFCRRSNCPEKNSCSVLLPPQNSVGRGRQQKGRVLRCHNNSEDDAGVMHNILDSFSSLETSDRSVPRACLRSTKISAKEKRGGYSKVELLL